MKEFLQDYDMVFAMAAVGCLTIMMKSIASVIYYRLLCQSEQMGTTQNKYMRAASGKFIAAYKLKREVHNVSCVVDRCLYNMRIMGISAISWKNIGIYGITAEILMFSIGTVGGLYYELTMDWFIINFVTLGITVIILAASEILFQLHRKYKMLQIQMVDYMENILKPKLEKEYLHPEETKKYQMEYFNLEKDTKEEEGEEYSNDEEDIEEETAPSMEQLKLLEEIMEEYLTD